LRDLKERLGLDTDYWSINLRTSIPSHTYINSSLVKEEADQPAHQHPRYSK
jgi:hypothetical protein